MNECVTFDKCAVSLGVMMGESMRRQIDSSLEEAMMDDMNIIMFQKF